MTQDLTQQTCEPCQGIGKPMTAEDAESQMGVLHEDWELSGDARQISRTFRFKGFARAVYTANLAAYLADREGHHPDVSFGWGYCTVLYTSHELGGLSLNDFICAAKLDKMVI